MTNKLIVILVIMGQFQVLMAQSGAPKILHGTVTFNSISPLEGITVTNNNSKRMVVSDQYGLFSILASAGDILSFSGVNYETLRKIITKEQFITGTFTADLTLKSIELKEIIIKDHSKITAENLGIIPKRSDHINSSRKKVANCRRF